MTAITHVLEGMGCLQTSDNKAGTCDTEYMVEPARVYCVFSHVAKTLKLSAVLYSLFRHNFTITEHVSGMLKCNKWYMILS